MFSNRLCLICAAAISFLMVPGCSKQTEDDDGGSTATPGSGKSLGGDNNTGTGTGTGTGTSSTSPNAVGSAVDVSAEEWDAIQTNACNAWAIEPESSPAKLQLVVDVSSSMNSAANGTGNRSKWEVTKDALIEAICGVNGPGLAANTSVGLMFYPNMKNEEVSSTPTTQDVCLNLDGITPMAKLESGDGSHREALRSTFETVQLGRGTPTADAYDYALHNIALTPEQLAVPGDTYMLLITDGMPTLLHDCYNPAGTLSNLPGDEVVALVRGAWQNNQVKTFIIGSPGSEQMVDWLSQAAIEGQTPAEGCNTGGGRPYCHMDMTTAADFSAALRDGLNQVVAAVSGCKFEVPARSANGLYTVNPDDISPLVNWGDGSKQLILRHNSTSEDCVEGYRLIEGGSKVEMCDGTCSRFTADPNAKMQLIFGCSAEIETNLL